MARAPRGMSPGDGNRGDSGGKRAGWSRSGAACKLLATQLAVLLHRPNSRRGFAGSQRLIPARLYVRRAREASRETVSERAGRLQVSQGGSAPHSLVQTPAASSPCARGRARGDRSGKCPEPWSDDVSGRERVSHLSFDVVLQFGTVAFRRYISYHTEYPCNRRSGKVFFALLNSGAHQERGHQPGPARDTTEDTPQCPPTTHVDCLVADYQKRRRQCAIREK